jgi:CheY-like chemotaxis protein
MTESPDETMPQASPTDESAPYRVLVVEDDRSQALFAQSVLNGAGIEATLQTEAAGVLDAIRAHKPDLVLMDLHLPGSTACA